jgi:4,5-DOPA dioxygenase extradiol
VYVDRRDVLKTIASVLFAAPATARAKSMSGKMPVIFAAHGAPMLLDDAAWVGALASWAKAIPKPRAVLMVSAHWDERPLAIGATTKLPLIYDFYGFPERYYRLQYDAPGAPELADRVRALLQKSDIPHTDHPKRGLDHGAYVPLMCMYPETDVPVLQISLPGLDTKALFELGRTLAPLRDEGTLIFGSGFLTHNMSYAFTKGTPAWAKEFDAWSEGTLTKHDYDGLLDFQKKAPAARLALPTWEHFAPVIVSAAAAGADAKVSFPITGWWMDGAFTKRSVQFG